MNAEPHTHDVQIRRRYLSGGGPLEVTYGDTTVSTLSRWDRFLCRNYSTNHPSEERIRWAIRKAIRLHDEGSRKASQDADCERAAVDKVRAEFADLPRDRWASEVIAQHTTPAGLATNQRPTGVR